MEKKVNHDAHNLCFGGKKKKSRQVVLLFWTVLISHSILNVKRDNKCKITAMFKTPKQRSTCNVT